MIRNIVFDMGNVLMRYHPLETCRAAAADEEGCTNAEQRDFWASLNGQGWTTIPSRLRSFPAA